MAQQEKQQKGFDEPKIVYTIKLIEAQERIAFLLNDSKYGQAAQEIATLLLRIEIPKDETDMQKLKKELTLDTYISFKSQDTNAAFATLCAFLNRTYFADYHKAKPRYGKGKL